MVHETYFGPAVIVGQFSAVQNSVRVPKRRFTWLKKSTAGKIVGIYSAIVIYEKIMVDNTTKKGNIKNDTYMLSGLKYRLCKQ